MERTSSKSGLLIETTSYDQDLSAHSNPLASASEHSGLHAVSSTPLDEQPPHPLASSTNPPSMSINNQQMNDVLDRNSMSFPPAVSLPGPPQYHINLTDTDALMRRAQEMGLLDPMNPLNSTALPQFQRLLAANLSNKLQGDLATMQMQQLQHPILHLQNQQQRFSMDDKPSNPTHQYNLSTITEQTSSSGSQADSIGIGSNPPAFNGGSNVQSSSGVNGFGSGAGGITSLTAPSPVQQVIGALQSSQQQQTHERRPSRLNRAAASFRRSRRSWSSRRKRDSSGGSDRRGSNDSSKYYKNPKPPPVGFNVDANDASREKITRFKALFLKLYMKLIYCFIIQI